MNSNGRSKPPNGGKRPKKRAKRTRNGRVALLRTPWGANDDENWKTNAAEDTVRERFIECYEQSFGNVTLCCDVTGISRTTFYRWNCGTSVRDREFQKRLEELRPADRFLDAAEAQLAKLMSSSDERVALQATQTVLRLWGKIRGLTDRPEQQSMEQLFLEESFRQLKAVIEREALENGVSYQEELRFFFSLPVSQTVKPEIAEKLRREIET